MTEDGNGHVLDGIRIDRMLYYDSGLWKHRAPGSPSSTRQQNYLRTAFSKAQRRVRNDGGGNIAIIVPIDPGEPPLDVLIGTPKGKSS